MRFKKRPQLPGAGRTRGWHHHGSHTPTSPGAILNVKWPITPNKSACSVKLNYREKKIMVSPGFEPTHILVQPKLDLNAGTTFRSQKIQIFYWSRLNF